MEKMKNKIAENLKRVQDNIAQACIRVRRDPREVKLVAVTKTVDINIIRMLLEMGQLDLGESRVQDLLQRAASIRESAQNGLEPTAKTDTIEPAWHMIGHLQRNKVKQLLPVVKYIHSVDSLRLAEEINTAAAKLGLAEKVKIFLEVKTSQEKQKFGLPVGSVSALAEQIETLPNLQIAGLMTMAPLTDNKEICRFCFGRLKEIFEEMRGKNMVSSQFKHLSMGMSNDYVVAVEEGATMVRVGSALFS